MDGYGTSPLIPCHRTILNSSSGIASSWVRLKCSDLLCHLLNTIVLLLRSIRAGMDLNGLRSAFIVKEFHIGVAAASYWLMGGKPSISSIVLTRDVVEYMVLSANP